MNEITLKKTSDYSLFSMHKINRLLVSVGGFEPRKKLADSMKKHGFRRTQPIRCIEQDDGKMLIFDGHNRFMTAKALNIPLWYISYPKSEADYIDPLKDNEGQIGWSPRDIVSARSHENADYAEVLSFCETTGIPLNVAFSMFYGQSGSSHNISNYMKDGRFSIKDRNLPWKVAAVVRAACGLCSFARTTPFVSAVSKCMFAEGFSHERLIERINRRPDLLRKCGFERGYIAMLEEVYNHSTRGERLYLQAEVEKAMRRRDPGKKKRQESAAA